MKKKLMVVVITVVVLIFAALYAIDMRLMAENKSVVFSTWGYDYTPPVAEIKPPVLKLADKDGNLQAECLYGSYCWKENGGGVCSDYPPPYERQYETINTVSAKGMPLELFVGNKDCKIKRVLFYDAETKEEIDSKAVFDKTSVMLDLKLREYIVELLVGYEQGDVLYCFKVINK